METKTTFVTVGLVLALAACNDRTAKVDPKGDAPSLAEREAACQGHCERIDSCFPEVGLEGVDDMQSCVRSCLTEGVNFTEPYKSCWDEAIASLGCMNALTCEEWVTINVPGEYDGPPESRPCLGTQEDPGPMRAHSSCIADLESEAKE